jgi:hypothetical protein
MVPRFRFTREWKTGDMTKAVTGGTAAFFLLNVVTEGSASSNRNGDKIIMQMIEIRFHFAPTYVVNPVDFPVRFILFYDSANNNSASNPQMSSIIYNSTPTSIDTTMVYGNYNYNFGNRYQILYDRIWNPKAVESATAVPILSTDTPHDYILMSGRWPVQYSATAGTQADIVNGALWLCVMPVGGGNMSGATTVFYEYA